ncbi:uncharacterized protein [Apostichopus japonicus]|uniref:uncharacterized protein n=1 Tax=Stichopus japonicus TaxID=307972 RepID=UPI003AB7F1A6
MTQSHQGLSLVNVLAFVTIGYCCGPTYHFDNELAYGSTITYGTDPNEEPELAVMEVAVPVEAVEAVAVLEELEHVAIRSVLKNSDKISPETFFQELDENSDGLIDACEWLKTPYGTRVKDFAHMVLDIDSDGDDALTLEELKSVKITRHKM